MRNLIAGTKNASGDNTLIAAPGAGMNIVVSSIVIQNESAIPTTILLKSGSTVLMRHLLQNQGDVFGRAWENGAELELGDNEALILNLSAANSHGYNVEYWTESVTVH